MAGMPHSMNALLLTCSSAECSAGPSCRTAWAMISSEKEYSDETPSMFVTSGDVWIRSCKASTYSRMAGSVISSACSSTMMVPFATDRWKFSAMMRWARIDSWSSPLPRSIW